MKTPALVGLLAALWALGCEPSAAPAGGSDGLSEAARQAVRGVERAYVEGWLAGDSTAVMATLAPEAVIVPDGMEPIRGDSAIRAYWWPRDGSETRVTAYETTIDEVGGSGDLAFLRGTGRLSFDWRSDPDSAWSSYGSRSVWLALLDRDPDETWRMTHRMWHRVDR